MKSNCTLFIIAILLFSKLSGMEKPQSNKRMIKNIHSLKQIVSEVIEKHPGLIDKCDPKLLHKKYDIKETTQSILGRISTIQDTAVINKTITEELSKIPLDKQYQIIKHFLYLISSNLQHQNNDYQIISFLNNFLSSENIPYLPLLRSKLFNRIITLGKSAQKLLGTEQFPTGITQEYVKKRIRWFYQMLCTNISKINTKYSGNNLAARKQSSI